MIWAVRVAGQDALVLTVSDSFLHGLLARVGDAELKQLDPYRDGALDHGALLRWSAELRRIELQVRDEVTESLIRTRELPQDSAAREAILGDWIERALAADEEFQTLLDVEAAVGLTLEANGTIEMIGD